MTPEKLSKDGRRTYRTLVADPPWPYAEFATGRPGWRKGGDIKRRVGLPYPSLTVTEIRSLPVAALTGDDAFLFLWTTNRYLPDAFDVMRGWGFTYRQTLVWDKGSSMSPLGGAVAPNRAEYLLVGRRGKPSLKARWAGGSVVEAPNFKPPGGGHSRKPDVFLDLVETVCSGPYCELFARRQRLGWDSWGDEALCHVDLCPLTPNATSGRAPRVSQPVSDAAVGPATQTPKTAGTEEAA